MKRQTKAILLLTNWLVGLLLIFSFQSPVHASEGSQKFSTFETGNTSLAESIQLPEVPSFELDIKIPFQPVQLFFFEFSSPVCAATLFPDRFDSIPLFDIKSTFIHFYYTW